MTTSTNFSCDGEFEIVNITKDLYDEVEELFSKVFMHHENICIATNLLTSQQAIEEIKRLLRFTLDDGVSFAIREINSKKVVAICCNKIINPSRELTFDELFKTFSSKVMLTIGDFLHQMESTYDIHKEWQIDCVAEMEFIVVDLDFGRRGLATRVTEHSLNFFRRMSKGNLTHEEEENLAISVRNERPKAAVSVFTTLYTQKLGDRLGFETLNRMSHKDFSFDGKTFAERIDPIHENSTYAALRL